MEYELTICYLKNGYSILCDDGTPMKFVDDEATEGLTLKDAIDTCTRHEYKFKVV